MCWQSATRPRPSEPPTRAARQIRPIDQPYCRLRLLLQPDRAHVLRRLTELRRLSLQSNRLESTQGLGACTALEELYLSHNGIATLQALGRARRFIGSGCTARRRADGLVHVGSCRRSAR